MTPIVKIADPIAAVLEEARRWVGTREVPPGSNRGVAIDFFNFHTVPAWEPYPQGVRGAPWCAAFVSTVGRLALGLAWPVERTVSCQTMVQWARDKDVWYPHPEEPAIGDLFVLYYERLGRHGHVGFVTGVDDESILTLEGNTGPAGSREGFGVFERERRLNEQTGFVRWVEAI